jgi:hypothetical protein
MVQVRQESRTSGLHAGESSPIVWFAIAAASALLFLLVIAAANSGGLGHLLPKDQLFDPHYTT